MVPGFRFRVGEPVGVHPVHPVAPSAQPILEIGPGQFGQGGQHRRALTMPRGKGGGQIGGGGRGGDEVDREAGPGHDLGRGGADGGHPEAHR